MLKQEEIKFEHLKPTSTDEQSLTQTFFNTFEGNYLSEDLQNYKLQIFFLSSKHEIHFF